MHHTHRAAYQRSNNDKLNRVEDHSTLFYFYPMANTSAYAGNVPANYEEYLGPVLFEPYAIDIADRLTKNAVNVLELACGTGRVTRHLLQRLSKHATLTATDLNQDMINVAASLVKDQRVQWKACDAQALPFDDETFDTVVSQFGVMFFPDKVLAMAEARRVLKPGGTFLFNTWDQLDANPRSAIIKAVMTKIMGAEAPDFLSKGPYSYFDKAVIAEHLTAAGFEDVQMEMVHKTSAYPHVDHLIKGFVDGSPLGAYLAQQPAALREATIDALRQHVIREHGTTNISCPMQAIIVQARKPLS